MIAPRWAKFRIGPFLRGEHDKRQYQLLFTSADQVAGIERAILLSLARRIEDSEWEHAAAKEQAGRLVVCFRSMERVESLAGRQHEVAAALSSITRPRFLPRDIPDTPFIGVHVRRGDFTEASGAELSAGAHCRRIPLDWYVEALLTLRRELGPRTDARIFSDAAPADLEPLLRIPGTVRYDGRTAITDMMALSKASVIIASGSAFSMWASYLGGTPAVWHPGQNFSMRRTWGEKHKDIEWSPATVLDTDFIRLIGH